MEPDINAPFGITNFATVRGWHYFKNNHGGKYAEFAEYFRGSREFTKYTFVYERNVNKTIEAQAKKCFSHKKNLNFAFGKLIMRRICQLDVTWGHFTPLAHRLPHAYYRYCCQAVFMALFDLFCRAAKQWPWDRKENKAFFRGSRYERNHFHIHCFLIFFRMSRVHQ